jgi:hypothetical protein
MKKSLVGLVGLAALAIAFVLPHSSRAAQTAYGVKVLLVMTYLNGQVDAQFSNLICDDAGAAKDWGQIVPLADGATADGVKGILSLLTAAKLSNRDVILYTSGFLWGCKITAVELR